MGSASVIRAATRVALFLCTWGQPYTNVITQVEMRFCVNPHTALRPHPYTPEQLRTQPQQAPPFEMNRRSDDLGFHHIDNGVLGSASANNHLPRISVVIGAQGPQAITVSFLLPPPEHGQGERRKSPNHALQQQKGESPVRHAM